jgi:hypothetical protein
VHDVEAMDVPAERGATWCARIRLPVVGLAMATACAHPRPVTPPLAFEDDEPIEGLVQPGGNEILGIVVLVQPPPLLRFARSFVPDDDD